MLLKNNYGVSKNNYGVTKYYMISKNDSFLQTHLLTFKRFDHLLSISEVCVPVCMYFTVTYKSSVPGTEFSIEDNIGKKNDALIVWYTSFLWKQMFLTNLLPQIIWNGSTLCCENLKQIINQG